MDDSIDVARLTQAVPRPPSELQTSRTPPLSLPRDWRSNPAKFFGLACSDGNFEVVRYILDEVREGPDLDDIKDRFYNNVHLACSKGYLDVLTCLLEHGAEVGRCPMMMMFLEDTNTVIRIYEVLFKYGLNLADYPEVLHSWIKNETVLEYLLSKGADPNGLDKYDFVPLRICESRSAIKILINYGADVSKAPMLQQAICFPDHSFTEERCEFLLSIGVDINARAKFPVDAPPRSKIAKDLTRGLLDGGTALHFVVRGSRGWDTDRLPRAKWLLDHGAKVDIKDDCGLMPLEYAATDQSMIDLLESYRLRDGERPILTDG